MFIEEKKMQLRIKTLIGVFITLLILTSSTTSFAETVTYTYDNLNRLTSVDYGNGTTITYTYDAAGNRLTMTAVAPVPVISVSPTSHDFGSIEVGNISTAQTLTIFNTGTAGLVIGTLFITGTDASEFSIQNDNCSGQTIPASESRTVDVIFSPTSEGSKSVNLSIPSNDPDTPILYAPLNGTGTGGYSVDGDLNGDSVVNRSDYMIFRSTLGKCSGDAGFVPEADYDEDGCITYADYRIWYGYYRNQ